LAISLLFLFDITEECIIFFLENDRLEAKTTWWSDKGISGFLNKSKSGMMDFITNSPNTGEHELKGGTS